MTKLHSIIEVKEHVEVEFLKSKTYEEINDMMCELGSKIAGLEIANKSLTGINKELKTHTQEQHKDFQELKDQSETLIAQGKEIEESFLKFEQATKGLEAHRCQTCGLWATDLPDRIPEDIKDLFFEIKYQPCTGMGGKVHHIIDLANIEKEVVEACHTVNKSFEDDELAICNQGVRTARAGELLRKAFNESFKNVNTEPVEKLEPIIVFKGNDVTEEYKHHIKYIAETCNTIEEEVVILFQRKINELGDLLKARDAVIDDYNTEVEKSTEEGKMSNSIPEAGETSKEPTLEEVEKQRLKNKHSFNENDVAKIYQVPVDILQEPTHKEPTFEECVQFIVNMTGMVRDVSESALRYRMIGQSDVTVARDEVIGMHKKGLYNE